MAESWFSYVHIGLLVIVIVCGGGAQDTSCDHLVGSMLYEGQTESS